MIYLFNHSGSKNHGCEAIVRSTNKIIGNHDIILFSLNATEDKKYSLDTLMNIISDVDNNLSKKTLKYYLSALEIKIKKTSILNTIFKRKKLLKTIKKNDIVLSIGGDTYCYPGYENLINLNYLMYKKKIKTVLWGCSIEPILLEDKKLIKDMMRYKLIVVRESLTYKALLTYKINNVVLCPDPAFQLDKIDLPLPENFIVGNTVGINVSPLIISHEKSKGVTKLNYIKLIENIISTTDMNIALIPHVIWKDNDDRVPLRELYEIFKDTKRICLIDDHNCMELKGYISKCRFFVGARTHATIAAYSTCIPTLVVGYSIKAKGIAKDIFGTYKNYVIPVQSLMDENNLLNAFLWIEKHEKQITDHLIKFMPNYIERVLDAKNYLEQLLK